MNFEEYLIKEGTIEGLDDIEIAGFQAWRLVRTNFRDMMIRQQTSTVKPIIHWKDVVQNTWESLAALKKIRKSGVKVNNLFFPHPRLFLVGNKYVERMSDPLIDYSGIGEDYLIFERYQNGIHQKPRIHGDHVIYLDYLENVATALKIILMPFYSFYYREEIAKMMELLSNQFEFDEGKVKSMFVRDISFSIIRKRLITPYLRKLQPKNVYLATRDSFRYVISYCKENGINTIELQHGITVGETTLYSGKWSEKSDPDFFFVFGKSSVGSQFGIPLERLFNIGFPYKNYIANIDLPKYGKNTTLVISEPNISEKIIDVVRILAKAYPSHQFHIRCHPQEKLSDSQKKVVNSLKNVAVVDNNIESFCALSQYEYVIGENSTVLYEAMSLGKKVARINFGGLEVKETEDIHGGSMMYEPSDFGKFLSVPYDFSRDSKELYSDFDLKQFTRI